MYKYNFIFQMYDYARVKNDDFILVECQFDSIHSLCRAVIDVINTFFGRLDYQVDYYWSSGYGMFKSVGCC